MNSLKGSDHNTKVNNVLFCSQFSPPNRGDRTVMERWCNGTTYLVKRWWNGG